MSWTRSDQLALAGVLVAAIGVVAALLALRPPEPPKPTEKAPSPTRVAPSSSVQPPTMIGFSEPFSISENSTFPSKTGAKVVTGRIGAYWGGPPQAEMGAAAFGPVFGKFTFSKNLISKKLQPRALLARSTLTPTLSRKRERESEQVGSLSRVLVGEGWGEGDPSTG